jgi:hypothetical protein
VTQDGGPINPAWIPRDEVLNRMEELMKENGGDREKARIELSKDFSQFFHFFIYISIF